MLINRQRGFEMISPELWREEGEFQGWLVGIYARYKALSLLILFCWCENVADILLSALLPCREVKLFRFRSWPEIERRVREKSREGGNRSGGKTERLLRPERGAGIKVSCSESPSLAWSAGISIKSYPINPIDNWVKDQSINFYWACKMWLECGLWSFSPLLLAYSTLICLNPA